MNSLMPREKLIKNGCGALQDRELISIMLGSGIKGCNIYELSLKLVSFFDNYRGSLRYDDLIKIKGLGKAKVCNLIASYEFVSRKIKYSDKKICEPSDVLEHVTHLRYKNKENFVILSLNGANSVIKMHTISVGIANKTQVHPREIFAEIIKDRACAFIAVHNHPSGNLEPSEQDKSVTVRLLECGNIMGIKLLDHIIIAGKGYFSFAQNGYL